MQPGETFADFASGLRDAAGQNPVREETLLGQFYRELEKTTRQLVKLAPTTTTLGEAVDKATKIDDASYDVARGMRNIGHPWATSTTQAVNEQATFLKSRTEDECRRKRTRTRAVKSRTSPRARQRRKIARHPYVARYNVLLLQ
ncbi:hypothetical protein PI124_g1865 [Phytophthora idaei]|nr:hypothetical protein PI124_g1865 [Phytophthora idaei]